MVLSTEGAAGSGPRLRDQINVEEKEVPSPAADVDVSRALTPADTFSPVCIRGLKTSCKDSWRLTKEQLASGSHLLSLTSSYNGRSGVRFHPHLVSVFDFCSRVLLHVLSHLR